MLAANVPRPLAAEMSRSDDPFEPGPFTARRMSAPHDAYHRRFVDVMQGHMGASGGEAMERMYRAQCLKDDTMAEAIADHLRLHAHRRPLVVHLNGKFHSDHGHGTVQRVVERMPGVTVGLVSMLAVEEPTEHEPTRLELGRANFLFLVKPPKKEKEVKKNEEDRKRADGTE